MFAPNTHSFYRQIAIGLIGWIVFGGIATAMAPALLPFYLVACIILALKSCKVAFVTERFTDSASIAILNSLAVCPLLSLVTGLVLFIKLMPLPQAVAIGFSLTPSLFVFTAWLVVFRRFDGKKSPFIVRGNHISYEPIEPDKKLSAWVGGVIAATGASLFSMTNTQNHIQTSIWLYIFFSLIGIYQVFHLRHAIAGLRKAKNKELQSGQYFTFENISEIRRLRHRSWLARRIGRLLSRHLAGH